ncbi:MAG: S41 family peptidase [Caldilineaceae bacterium]|nr:S41 family peptidase [Caldilineaceae bacterium]MCB0141046.1 S41 family peptidase [Caldilineaceae bacterium]
MNSFGRWAVITVLLVGLTLGSFFAGAFVGAPLMAQAQSSLFQPKEFDVFWQAWNLVQENFVDREALNNTNMTYGAIQGMLNSLGDEGHTAFLTPEQLKQKNSDISGKYSGIGARIGVKDTLPMIVAPFDGSPADKAGIKAGDIIMKVDDVDTSGMPLDEVINMIRGEEGTDVMLTILRVDQDEAVTLEINITRGEIEIPAASWTMVPGTDVALLRLSQFSANATESVQEAANEAKTAGADAMILDIRNNPGGLLEQAINVSSQFLKSGNVLQEEDAQGNRREFKVRSGGVATDIPLVVLINEGSASSAEILAGALQDQKRAKLIGETTFGTGTVLQPYQLKDGSAIMLGTKQWLTANGRLIRKHGIEPDITLDLPIEADLLTPAEIKELTLDDVLASEDKQLVKALEELNAIPPQPKAEAETETEPSN